MPALRSALAGPGGARLVGAGVALAGIALLIVGVVALGGGDGGTSGAAPAPTGTLAPPASTTLSPSAPATTAPTGSPLPTAGTGVGSEPATTPPPVPPPSPTATRPTVARAPLTVLNNSTVRGLADQAARAVQDRGWVVAQVGNFAGRLPATTVYYDPGDAAEEAAARQLAREFPQVTQVLPRYAGLPPTPAGIVLVVTRDWS